MGIKVRSPFLCVCVLLIGFAQFVLFNLLCCGVFFLHTQAKSCGKGHSEYYIGDNLNWGTIKQGYSNSVAFLFLFVCLMRFANSTSDEANQVIEEFKNSEFKALSLIIREVVEKQMNQLKVLKTLDVFNTTQV